MDENLHASGGQERIWCPMTFAVASTGDTWLFLTNAMAGLQENLGFPQFGGPKNM